MESDRSKLLEDKTCDRQLSPSKKSSSKTRRREGEGSGCIYWCTVTRNGKDYQQAYYHYEFWEGGDLRSSGEASRLVKSSLSALPCRQAMSADRQAGDRQGNTYPRAN